MGSPAVKQQEIYRFILYYTEKNGFPPSVREIGDAVGLRSPSTVHAHIKALHEQGLIHKSDRKTRAISTAFSSGGIPILGKVTAGSPIYAFEEDCGRLAYRTDSPEQCFALKVRGDSMINAGILDGDYVVVRRMTTTQSGTIVVALIDDEATVKRFVRKNSHVWLMPENPNYDPINGDECSLLGKVIAVVREL